MCRTATPPPPKRFKHLSAIVKERKKEEKYKGEGRATT